MKMALGFMVAVVCIASVAQATDLNVRVLTEAGLSEDRVRVGSVVNYKVVGELSDDLNEGLALVGMTLAFDGGDLTRANSPTDDGVFNCENPMLNFVKPYGITNPGEDGDGFGGTVIAGDLVQVGGGQNTILNGQQPCTFDSDCPTGSMCQDSLCDRVADFPVGTVLIGVAQPAVCGEAVLARGSLTMPETPGTYTLSIVPGSLFANVIRHMETGEDFYATEAATPGTVMNLTLNGRVAPPPLVSSVPAFSAPGELPAGSLWRSANNIVRLTFGGDITVPDPGDVEIVEMLEGPSYGSDMSASFTFEVEDDDGGDPRVLKIREVGAVLSHRSWYAIRNTGSWAGASNFEAQWPLQMGDANGDLRVLFNDLGAINTQVGCFSDCGDDNRFDINGDGRILFNDLGAANVFVGSFPVSKPAGH